MTALVLACLAFMAFHALPSMRLRATLVKAIGEKVYSGLFSLVSLGLLWAMTTTYSSVPPETAAWVLGTGARWVMALAVGFAFFLLIAGVGAPNPTGIGGGGAGSIGKQHPALGVLRITRQPVMMAIAVWALVHMVARPELGALVFFGSLAVTAIGGAWLQEKRKRAQMGDDWTRFEQATSLLPFGAIVTGRNHLAMAEIGWLRIAIGLAAWGMFLYFHGTIIGVTAIAF
ncbi:MAG: NnrU family protein [Alphaproteobacteria bacterium]